MPTTGTVELRLKEDRLPVPLFADYLYHLRVVYAVCLDVVGDRSVEQVLKEKDALKEKVLAEFRTLRVKGISDEATKQKMISRNLGGLELYITDAATQSPFEIDFSCCVPALTLAAIICGGEVGFRESGSYLKINSLIECLSALRKAISAHPSKEDDNNEDDSAG